MPPARTYLNHFLTDESTKEKLLTHRETLTYPKGEMAKVMKLVLARCDSDLTADTLKFDCKKHIEKLQNLAAKKWNTKSTHKKKSIQM